MCFEKHLGEFARARLAFNMVDYITSEGLPFHVFVTRAPQAMAAPKDQHALAKVFQFKCTISGKVD
jgi:hypothetical protein